MKYFTTQNIFKYSWDQVVSGFWNRYPNPHSSHVLTEDTISRQVDRDKLYSKRFITKTNHLPKWGERFVPGPRNVCIIEESVVDPKERTLTTYTRNIGMTRVMTVDERCVYRPSVEHPGWTECERQAWVTSSLYGFIYALQKFGMERYKKNAQKSVRGFDHVLQRLYMPDSIPDQTPMLGGRLNPERLLQKAHKAQEKAQEKAQKAKQLAKTVVVPN